jgi:hypothetical protein
MLPHVRDVLPPLIGVSRLTISSVRAAFASPTGSAISCFGSAIRRYGALVLTRYFHEKPELLALRAVY